MSSSGLSCWKFVPSPASGPPRIAISPAESPAAATATWDGVGGGSGGRSLFGRRYSLSNLSVSYRCADRGRFAGGLNTFCAEILLFPPSPYGTAAALPIPPWLPPPPPPPPPGVDCGNNGVRGVFEDTVGVWSDVSGKGEARMCCILIPPLMVLWW